jgi:hypothetical protein
LLVFDETSIVGDSGFPAEVCIENVIEELSDGCFLDQCSLSIVSFESNSRLRRIGERAFAQSSLRSIDIPSSVEIIGKFCFTDCNIVSIIRSELASQLSVLDKNAFLGCSGLKTI